MWHRQGGPRQQAGQGTQEQLDTKQEWKTINEEVRFSFNGAPVLGHSTITPASQLGDIFQSKYATG